jgi:hypothetical protein
LKLIQVILRKYINKLRSVTSAALASLKEIANMREIKSQIDSYSKILPLNGSISQPEAERRAGEFLTALALIADYRHIFGEERIRHTSVQTAVYAEQMAKGTAKTVTENKLTAEASEEYTKAREELERTENDITYLKAYNDIFMAAHVLYRNLAKGESGL